MKWYANKIIYDLDLEEGETYNEAVKKLSLPEQVKIPDELALGDYGINDDVTDYISDQTGYCVVSFVLDCE